MHKSGGRKMAITEIREEGEEEQTSKKAKTTQQHQQGIDRISQLSDDILHPILSLLTLKEACITSALSKRWRNLFPSLPSLDIGFYSFGYSSVQQHASGDPEIHIERWLESVSDILESRCGPVRNCTIRSYYFHQYRKDFGNIVRFLCNNGIQELILYNMVTLFRRYYTVPSCLYLCQTPTRIELRKCILKVPSTFGGLRRLNALKIEDCIVEDGDLQRLILGCSAVERLIVDNCHRFLNLAVVAPKLAVLDVTTHRPLELSIVNAPLLESVTVRFRHDHPGEFPDDSSGIDDEDDDAVSRLVRLLKSLGGIRNLTLEFQNRYLKTSRMEGLALLDTVGSLLPKMEKLTLKMQLNLPITVTTVSCLLNSCPNLVDLVIVLDKDGNDPQYPEFSVLKYWYPTIPSDCMRNTLCTVTFYLQEGCWWTPGIQLVKFLLEHARVLKSFVIDCCHQEVGLSKLEDLHREMFLFRPASPFVVMELKTPQRRISYRPALITFGAL